MVLWLRTPQPREVSSRTGQPLAPDLGIVCWATRTSGERRRAWLEL